MVAVVVEVTTGEESIRFVTTRSNSDVTSLGGQSSSRTGSKEKLILPQDELESVGEANSHEEDEETRYVYSPGASMYFYKTI